MLPGVVYLETSILDGLPFDLGRADFIVFRELCDKYGVALATTRLCADECIENLVQFVFLASGEKFASTSPTSVVRSRNVFDVDT